MPQKTGPSSEKKNDSNAYPEQPNWPLSDIVELDISKISKDPRFVFREKLNDEKLKEYAKICAEAKNKNEPFPFPPSVVFKIGGKIVRLSGNHRLTVAEATDWTSVPVRFFEGDLKDALRFGLSDNRHGAALTRGDKRVSIELALKKKLYKSNRELARAIGCDEKYVRLIKDEIEGKNSPKVRSTPQPTSPKPRFKSVDELFRATTAELKYFVTESIGKLYAEFAIGLLDNTGSDDTTDFVDTIIDTIAAAPEYAEQMRQALDRKDQARKHEKPSDQ